MPASAGQRLAGLFPFEHSSLAPKVPTGHQVRLIEMFPVVFWIDLKQTRYLNPDKTTSKLRGRWGLQVEMMPHTVSVAVIFSVVFTVFTGPHIPYVI